MNAMRLLLISCVIINTALVVAAPPSGKNVNSEKRYIKEIENYLNNLKSADADFIQIGADGRVSRGRFLLVRLYLMKMDYLKPATRTVIVKNRPFDSKVISYDKELNEKSVTTAHSSPVSFLLQKKIDLLSTVKVLSIDDKKDTLSITCCKKNEDDEGAIMIGFQNSPFKLLGWQIFPNKQQLTIERSIKIILQNLKTDVKISENEFTVFD